MNFYFVQIFSELQRFDEGLFNGGRALLGLVQRLQELFVFKNVSFGACQLLKQTILQFGELNLKVFLGLEQLSFLRLQLGFLVLNSRGEELPGKTRPRGCKVYNCGDSGRVRRQQRVRVPRGYVQFELVVVVDGFVADLHHIPGSLTLQFAPHYRIKYGLNKVHLLNDQRLAKSHCQFNLGRKVAILLN